MNFGKRVIKMSDVFETDMRVEFCDLDEENRLSMKGTMRLMQEASDLHSDLVKLGVNQMQDSGLGWVLYQQRCRLYFRPGWNTRLKVSTWSRGQEGIFCLRDFRMKDEDGRTVAEATSYWLTVDLSTGKMVKLKEADVESYGRHDEKVFEEPLRPLKPLKSATEVWRYQVQKRDIDINHHVNNLCYLDYAMEALPDGTDPEDFCDVEVIYRKASFPGQTLIISADWEDDNTWISDVRDEKTGLLHTVIRMKRMEK